MLTPEQVQQINSFFEDNGLELDHLRIELVDHVSEAIEYSMKIQAGRSFEEAFEEETAKFNKKEFPVQNYEATLQYNPIKEWQYFTGNRITKLLIIFLLLTSPVVFLNYRQLVFVEILYVLVGSSWYLHYMLQFNKKYKQSRKQLGLYFSEGKTALLFPVMYFVFLVLKPLFKGVQPVQGKTEWIFIVLVFCELSIIAALMAKTDAKKRQYNAAKKAYPLLFES